jgi:uncharacterized protein (TIGR00645 family)
MSSHDASRRRGLPFGRLLEAGLFASRWLLAPFYMGLVVTLFLLLVVFVHELWIGAPLALSSPEQAILLVLSLVDLSLAGNLVLIVTLSGYENFVSKIDTGDKVDRLVWMGSIDFSGMKLKLIGSIVAISAISLLKAFMEIADAGDAGAPAASGHPHVPPPDATSLSWMLGLHAAFVVSGVLFALMDYIAVKVARSHSQTHNAA